MTAASLQRFRLIGALACALIASAAGRAVAQTPAAAQPAESPQYRQMVDEAVREFRDGHWEEARALFGRAHQMEPSARTLRGLGMTAYELRMYVQSIRELDAALRETHKPLDTSMRAAADALIIKARAFTAHVQIKPTPAVAVLLVDGRQPQPEADGTLLLDAGTHVANATADGFKPTSLRFSVEGGHDQVLQLPLEPLLAITAAIPAIDPLHPAPRQPAQQPAAAATPSPAPPPAAPRPAPKDPTLGILAWVTLGGAVAFGTGAAVTWLIGDGKYDQLANECMHSCEQSEIDDAGVATTDTLTTVFLGVAVASGVASGVLFAVSLGGSDEQDPVTVGVVPNGLRLRGAF